MNTRLYAVALLFFPFLFPSHSDAQTAKSLLWEVSGNGLSKPSYLYGTMHVGDKRAHDFSDATMKAFNGASAFAGELNMAEVDRLAVLNLMKLTPPQKLNELFTADEWAKVTSYCQERLHVNVNDFLDYNIFFIYSLVAQSQFKNQKGEAVDIFFYNQAKQQGKELLGLEKVEEQIQAINRMSVEEQKKLLLGSLDKNAKTGEKEMKQMLKYYMKGDLDKLLEMSDDAELGDNFETAMVTERNHHMADRMVPLMEKASTFVAVGALHLPGEEGVIQLLREKGYKVEAVQ